MSSSASVHQLRRQIKAAGPEVALDIDGRALHLTNLDKVLWPPLDRARGGPEPVARPQADLRKRDLIDYYLAMSPYLLGHLRDRPLVMVRYPDGIEGEHWFHKDAPEHTPEWVRLRPIEQHGRSVLRPSEPRTLRYVVCDDLATLVWLAQLAAIEIHTWSAAANDPARADRAVFDIDPQTDEFADAVAGAQAVCELLDEIELPYYLKTTGKRGIHIFVPLPPQQEHAAAGFFTGEILRFALRAAL